VKEINIFIEHISFLKMEYVVDVYDRKNLKCKLLYVID
jgi:hypothetical protein